MSSLVFRDLSRPSRDGTATPPGLAAFASGAFGGEPLRVLDNYDRDIGIAHMGPRIYSRINRLPGKGKAKAKPSPVTVPRQAQPNDQEPPQSSPDNPYTHCIQLSQLPEYCAGISPDQVHRFEQQLKRAHNLEALARREAGADASRSNPLSTVAHISEEAQARTCALFASARQWRQSLRPGSHHPINSILAELDNATLLSPSLRLGVHSGIYAVLETIDTALNESELSIPAFPVLDGLVRLLLMQDSSSFPDALSLRLLRVFANNSQCGSLRDHVLQSWSLGEASLFREVVEHLASFVGRKVSSSATAFRHSPLVVEACRVLGFLATLNYERAIVPDDCFYVTALDMQPFLEDFVRLIGSDADTGLNLCENPCLLSRGAKARILLFENEMRLSAPRRSEPSVEFTLDSDPGARLRIETARVSLSVDRERVYEQSRDLFLLALDHDLVRPLRIEFIGEDAADGGGPTREWFGLLAQSFPLALALDAGAGLREAEWLGLFLGLALLHGARVSLPACVPGYMFRLAADPFARLTLRDLAEVDADLARSYAALLDWRGSEAEFASTFGVPTTLARREAFVREQVALRIREAAPYARGMHRGWAAVMPPAPTPGVSPRTTLQHGGHALTLLSPGEVRALATVDAVPLDIAALRAHSRAPRLPWFWDTWSALAPRDQRRLLAFITGSESLPLTGLTLAIESIPLSPDMGLPLPWSSTCTLTLFLPQYPDAATEADKIRKALEHYRGFGLR